VPILDDEVFEGESETFTVTLASAQHAELSADATVATATITDEDVLALASLQIVPGASMYPAFAPDIHHYAMNCVQSELRVTASALGSAAELALLRANADDNHTSIGSMDTTVTVNHFHDVVVELSEHGRSVRYVVHCIPSDFAQIKILKRLDSASDGLMFIAPRAGNVGKYGAVIDYNGVPRFVMRQGYNLRPLANGPTVDGKRVRYATGTALFDANFEQLHEMHTVSPIESINSHDIWVTNTGWLLIAYQDTTRDLSEDFEDEHGIPLSSSATVTDSVIQEVSVAGTQQFLWNSWNHLVLENDCLLVEKLARDHTEYAHLNSLQVVGEDIIASFRGCAQVLRIDRSEGTGAVEWKLGGSTETRASDTVHLPLVDDPAGEFCGQHQVTLTESDTVLMFDNGVQCLGPRKDRAPFSRVVEYDISSGTTAEFKRQYVRPSDQGYAKARGGVTHFDHDGQERWLVTWGGILVDVSSSLQASDVVAISELDPAILDRDPTADPTVFAMSLYNQDELVRTYRVYHAAQDDVVLPLNLP
jgi:hypothetical protein